MPSPTRETGRDAESIATAMDLLQGVLGLDFDEEIAAFRQFLQKRNATGGPDVAQGLDRGFANRLIGMVKVLDHLGLGKNSKLAQSVMDSKFTPILYIQWTATHPNTDKNSLFNGVYDSVGYK